MTIRLSERNIRASKLLLEMRAIGCNLEQPFKLTSGWASPVYVDCRRIISFPNQRHEIVKLMVGELREVKFDIVAGGETAGIPYAGWIAELLNLPMVYVRKKPKPGGRQEQVEGVLEAGKRVVLVEDLATDGASKVNFIDALRRAGAEVDLCVTVFYYGIFPKAPQIIKDAGVTLVSLTDWRSTIDAAESTGYFNADQVKGIREFLDDPEGWSRAHGGV
jgi:orotate phosphoribosyltransferase